MSMVNSKLKEISEIVEKEQTRQQARIDEYSSLLSSIEKVTQSKHINKTQKLEQIEILIDMFKRL